MKILRKILKGISLTAALFVFQACYGTPQASQSAGEGEAVEESVVEEDGEEVVEESADAAQTTVL